MEKFICFVLGHKWELLFNQVKGFLLIPKNVPFLFCPRCGKSIELFEYLRNFLNA